MERLFEIGKIAKASSNIPAGPHKGAYSAPYQPPTARTNVLMVIWSMEY